MTGLRIFFRDHAALAMLIVALALAVRAIVPAGYMTGSSSTGFTIELCSGVEGKTVAIAIAFILAIGLRRDTPPTAGRPGRLRPPLRGPPLAA